MNSLSSLWAKFYHMEGVELSFTRHEQLECYRLRMWINGVSFFDEIIDFCSACSKKKQENIAKFELLKRLNLKYEHHISE